METKDNLMGFLTSYVAAHPEVNLNTIVPNEKNIKRVLEILTYREVQKIAKDTIEYIIDEIKPGMPLKEIRFLCEEKMRELGEDSFWYYDIGAFFLQVTRQRFQFPEGNILLRKPDNTNKEKGMLYL